MSSGGLQLPARPGGSSDSRESPRSIKGAMHASLLNAISLVTGTGIALAIFLSIARFLSVQEQTASPVPDDLETVTLAMPPPPPPPKPDVKPAVVAEMQDAIPLGFQEEPSASPVKIAPSPPSYEQLLPMSRMPAHVVAGTLGIDATLKPKIDVTLDSDHVYQKSEVDKPPFVISRPDPAVPAHLQQNNKQLSVVVIFVVDAHGVVGKTRILRSSDSPEFDSIIAENICEWTFSPAIKKGKPVRCMIQQLVRVQWSHRDILSL